MLRENDGDSWWGPEGPMRQRVISHSDRKTQCIPSVGASASLQRGRCAWAPLHPLNRGTRTNF